MLKLDALTVSTLISFIIPVLTGVLTKATLATAWKGVITLVLNGVAAFVTSATLVDGTATITQQAIVQWALGMAISVAMYTGIYKKAGITSSTYTPSGTDVAVPGKLAPAVGLGPKT